MVFSFISQAIDADTHPRLCRKIHASYACCSCHLLMTHQPTPRLCLRHPNLRRHARAPICAYEFADEQSPEPITRGRRWIATSSPTSRTRGRASPSRRPACTGSGPPLARTCPVGTSLSFSAREARPTFRSRYVKFGSLDVIGCQPFCVYVGLPGYICSSLAGAWTVSRRGVLRYRVGRGVVRRDNHHQILGQSRLALCARCTAL